MPPQKNTASRPFFPSSRGGVGVGGGHRFVDKTSVATLHSKGECGWSTSSPKKGFPGPPAANSLIERFDEVKVFVARVAAAGHGMILTIM